MIYKITDTEILHWSRFKYILGPLNHVKKMGAKLPLRSWYCPKERTTYYEEI